MDINNSLVSFVYAGKASNVSSNAGVISFAQDTRQIYVGDGTQAVAFGGNVKDATFANNKLTIVHNSGDDIVLDFSTVASTEGVMAVFTALDASIQGVQASLNEAANSLNAKIENITKADSGAIAVAVKAEADLRAEADTSILNKIGTVTPDKTVVDMIADAKAEAVSAHSKVAAEENDFVTVDASQDASGATTYTIKVADVQSAAAYTEKMEKIDASFVTVEAAIETLNGTGENSVDGKIATAKAALDASISAEAAARKSAIEALDFEDSVSDTLGFVTVGLTQVDGKVTGISVDTADVASATELARVAGRIDTFLDSEEIAGTVDTLHEIKEWIDGEGGVATELTAALAKEVDDRAKADASIREDFAAADKTLDASLKAYADEVAAAAKRDAIAAVDASGDAYVSASAANGKITIAATPSTIASLGLADTAVQSVATGSANGTIAVDGTDVAVKGLGSAAFTEASAYDVAGAAADASVAVYASAKEYANQITVNEQTQVGQAITISGANMKVGGADGAHKDQLVSESIEDLYSKVDIASKAGVQSFTVNTDSSIFASTNVTTGAVSFSVKTKALADADASNNGLATAADVKNYVDTQINNAKLVWTFVE